jgi:hypothetical protein
VPGTAGNKAWLYFYDPENKQQSYQWRNPCPYLKKECQVINQEHINDFFDCEGTVHQKIVPAQQMVNQHYNQDLQCLREQVCQNHPEQQ